MAKESASSTSWIACTIAVGAAVALAFSNGCGSSSSGNGSSGDAGGSSGGSSGGSGGGSGGSGSGGGSGGSGSSSGGPVVGDGGVPGGQPGAGTTVMGCQIFPADNPWNTMIDGPGVELNHAYDANIPQSTHLHPDFGGWSNGYGIPFSVVPATQALQDTQFTQYADESDPGPMGWIGANPVNAGAGMGETMYPFFTGQHIEGNPKMAGGTPGNLPGDQHAIALQQGASGCHLYEAWNCVSGSNGSFGSPPFQCANGAVFDLTSNALRPLGWTSGDAAGLPIFAGLVRISDVKAGAITHAIRVTFNNIANDYILPAVHAAGSKALPNPPMGLRLRLKSSFDISKFHAESKVIATAMQKYGVMIADIGSDWYFSGDSDDGWNAMASDGADTIIDEIAGDFGGVSGSDFEAIQSGKAQNTGL